MALTEQKRRYADARLSGLTKKESAIAAGCPEKTASQAASRYEKDPDVIAALARSIAFEVTKDCPRLDDSLPYVPSANGDPILFMRTMMDHVLTDPRLRLDAAKALAALTIAKPGEKGKKAAQGEAAKEAVTGRFVSAPPPLRAVK